MLGPQLKDDLVPVAVLVGVLGGKRLLLARCPIFGRETFGEPKQHCVGWSAVGLRAQLVAVSVEDGSLVQRKGPLGYRLLDLAQSKALGLLALLGELGVGAAKVGEAAVTGTRAGAVGQVGRSGTGGGGVAARLGEDAKVDALSLVGDGPVRHSVRAGVGACDVAFIFHHAATFVDARVMFFRQSPSVRVARRTGEGDRPTSLELADRGEGVEFVESV